MIRIESVNVGRPEVLEWEGRRLTSAIRKRPLVGPVRVGRTGLPGDEQADLRVHGGVDKAIYAYPAEHYPFWDGVLGIELGPGALGENLTTRGLLEADLAIGDEVEIGSARLQVAQPRLPCVKLGALYDRADLPRRFVAAGRPGVYFRVLTEGEVRAGDVGRVVDRVPERWTVNQVFRVLTRRDAPAGIALRLAGLDPLGEGARKALAEATGFQGSIRVAAGSETARLGVLLQEAGLPRTGFPRDAAVVLAAVDAEDGVVGGVALERYGPAALLRSLVVAPGSRGRGVGAGLTRAALARAWGDGATSVGLLTETAAPFFGRMGFRQVSRDDLPRALGESEELRGACPEGALSFLSPRPSEAETAWTPGS
ncbi:MAG: GNAT family N-acetyltransferase [Gemmatimonadota bacterium]